MPVWFKRLRLLAVFILTALPAAVFLLTLQKPLFEARSSIAVAEMTTDMKNALALLHGGSLARQALDAVSGKRLFPQADADKRLKLFRQQLRIEPGGSARVFHIVFRHREQQLAAETVNVFVRLFAEELKKLESAALERELVLSRKQLRQAEIALAMFERNSPPQPLPEARHEELERLLADAAELERVAAEKFEELRQQFIAAAAGREDWTAFLHMKLYERGLRRKYNENDPLLASVRQQLEMQRTRLRQDRAEAEKLADRIAEAADVLGGQREEREHLQRQRGQFAAHAGQQSRPEHYAAARLRDDLAKSRVHLAQQLDKLAAQQQSSLVTIVAQPVLPLKPARTRQQPFSLLAAACFGLLCALLFRLKKEQGGAA